MMMMGPLIFVSVDRDEESEIEEGERVGDVVVSSRNERCDGGSRSSRISATERCRGNADPVSSLGSEMLDHLKEDNLPCGQ